MLLLRLVILALAIWLIFKIFRWQRARPASTPANEPSEKPRDMVRCVQCGLHLPPHEAISHQGQYYCCKQHLPMPPGKTE